jgi:hypothetical protein
MLRFYSINLLEGLRKTTKSVDNFTGLRIDIRTRDVSNTKKECYHYNVIFSNWHSAIKRVRNHCPWVYEILTRTVSSWGQ